MSTTRSPLPMAPLERMSIDAPGGMPCANERAIASCPEIVVSVTSLSRASGAYVAASSVPAAAPCVNIVWTV